MTFLAQLQFPNVLQKPQGVEQFLTTPGFVVVLALYAALLFWLLLNPAKIKSALWFKFAVVGFAATMAIEVLWMFFDVWGNQGLSDRIASLRGGIDGALLGLSLVCLVFAQTGGSVKDLTSAAKGAEKKKE